MSLGERILKYRKKAGISQEELADRLNVTRQSISLWETDQTLPSLDNLIALADIFGISMDEICGRDVDEKTADYTTQKQTDLPDSTATEEKANYIAYCKTPITCNLLNKLNGRTSQIIAVFDFAVSIFCTFISLCILADMTANNLLVVFPIGAIVVLLVITVAIIIIDRKKAKRIVNAFPDAVYRYWLYDDHIDAEKVCGHEYSKFSIKYSDIKKTKEDMQYLYVYINDTILPLDKEELKENLITAKCLLKIKVDPAEVHNSQTTLIKRYNIQAILTVMFILSLLSLLLGFIVVMIVFGASPLPEFSEALAEYMWIFFLFVPISLASVILGIIFLPKKYKCKKNIIAGVIMCALLCLFGQFTFSLKGLVRHDDNYVQYLDNTLPIVIYDKSKYVSYTFGTTDDELLRKAMIKCKDRNEMLRFVQEDFHHFKRDLCQDFTKALEENDVEKLLKCKFFYLYNVSLSKDNYMDTDNSHYVLLAYNPQTNVMCSYEFIYQSEREVRY